MIPFTTHLIYLPKKKEVEKWAPWQTAAGVSYYNVELLEPTQHLILFTVYLLSAFRSNSQVT